MAFTRRSGRRFEANIWPGFVDAMTALLLVLFFVLSIFMVAQFVLRETISSQDERINTQDTELDQLTSEVKSLAEALGFEQRMGFNLEQEIERLDQALRSERAEAERQQAEQTALIASLRSNVEAQSGQIASFEEQVASLLAEQSNLQNQLVTLGQEREAEELARTETEAENSVLTARIADIEAGLAREISEKEAAQLALAQVREEVDAVAEEARLAAARREALMALVADLRARNAEAQAEVSEFANASTELDSLRAEAEALQTQIDEDEANRLAEAAAAEALRERLANSDAELTAMTLQLERQRKEAEDTLTLLAAARSVQDDLDARLVSALASAEENTQKSAALEAELESLRSTSEASEASLRARLAAAEADLATALAEIAALQREGGTEAELRQNLIAALAAKRLAEEQASEVLSEAEQREILLRTAQSELAAEQETSAEGRRQLEVLNQQLSTLRSELGSLQSLLDAAGARDEKANVQIEALGSRLNAALAQAASEQRKRAELEEAERKRLEEERRRLAAEAEELKDYRSEFFGQLRTLLGDQEGIRIAGDRFVFSSEVLFQPAQARLSLEGQSEVAKVAEILGRVIDDIPENLDWVIRVDGHTDNVPLSGTGRFRDNWELSQARALSVVRYMSEELGIPPDRLAANGFGEFQPISTGNTPADLAANRRIELKLTER